MARSRRWLSVVRGGSAALCAAAALATVACGKTDREPSARAEPSPSEPVASKLEGATRWATYSALDAGAARSFVLDFTDFLAPLEIPITDPGRLAEAATFSPDGSRLAFAIVERQAELPSTTPGALHAVIPALVSLWLVEATRGFEVRKLEVSDEIPWPRSIRWVDDHTLLAEEATRQPHHYYAIDIATDRTMPLGNTLGNPGPARVAPGKVAFNDADCGVTYWDPSLPRGVALPVGGCPQTVGYEVVWSPDGRYLAAVRAGEIALFATPGGVPRAIELAFPAAGGPVSRSLVRWAPDSPRFLVSHVSPGNTTFWVGDAERGTAVELRAPGPLDDARFASADVLLLDDRAALATWVLRLDATGNVLHRARLDGAAWSWDLGDRCLSSDEGALLFRPADATAEQAVHRVALEPERDLLPEKLDTVVPREGVLTYLDCFAADDAWLLYKAIVRADSGAQETTEYLLDLRAGTPPQRVRDLARDGDLAYQALHRGLSESDAAVLQLGGGSSSHLFWLPLSPPLRAIPMLEIEGTPSTLELPSRWPVAALPPPD